jgi:hypothetical protein
MSLPTNKVSVWIVCGSLVVRSRLREALNNVLVNPHISHFSSGKKIIEAPAADYAPAIILITRSIGTDEIVRIARLMKKEGSGAREAKIIVAIDGRGNLESSTVVELYLADVDGFISEPFSIQDIQMLMSTLFAKEGSTAPTDRTHHSTVYVLNDARPHIDLIAAQLAMGEDAPLGAKRELDRVSKTLEKLKKQNFREYNRAILDAFINVPPPKMRDITQGSSIKRKAPKLFHPARAIKEQLQSRNIPASELARIMRIS